MTPQEQSDLLLRIDERLKAVQSLMKSFATREELRPVKIISYGLVAIIVTIVATALVSLVIKGGMI